MAASDRMYSLASKRVTKWSETRLPRGWFAFQVLIGVALLGWLAWGVITGDEGATSQAQTAPAAVAGVTGEVTEQPSAAAVPVSEPTTPSPEVTGGGSGTVVLSDVSGGSVQVPADAAEAARSGLRAMFDSAAAALVPVVGGGTMPAPVRDFPRATISELTLVEAADDGQRFAFVATTDADGEGSTFAGVATPIVVVPQDGGWAVDRG